jgi:homoaconitase/3-isopropylmalate dehydratase large subunit
VEAQIIEEGILDILTDSVLLRQPGCSACLAMNDDKVPAGKYAVSTSNNFEGRQDLVQELAVCSCRCGNQMVTRFDSL